MKLLLAGGGTAGHCIPNLALMPELKKHFTDIRYLGTERGIEKGLVAAYRLPYYGINTPKMVRGASLRAIKNNLLIPFSLARAKRRCVEILKDFQPDAVFLKGGFVCLPVALACKRLKIPCVIHESDFSFGLANRLCIPSASKILTAFPQTAKKKKRALFVGAPLRGELFNVNKAFARKRYGFHHRKPVLLVVGGSSGAKGLNDLTLRALPLLLPRYQVLHILGKNTPLPEGRQGYLPLPYEKEMQYAYAAADLCLSRAGANALFELLALGVPTLAVPLPSGRGDQKENAAYFYTKGAVLTAEEKSLSPTMLSNLLNDLENRAPLLKNKMAALDLRGANARIAEKILRVASEKKSRFQ